MANSYASLYLSDVLEKVKDVALDTMMTPALAKDRDIIGDGTIYEYNDRVAQYNEGIRTFSKDLIRELVKMTEEEEK